MLPVYSEVGFVNITRRKKWKIRSVSTCKIGRKIFNALTMAKPAFKYSLTFLVVCLIFSFRSRRRLERGKRLVAMVIEVRAFFSLSLCPSLCVYVRRLLVFYLLIFLFVFYSFNSIATYTTVTHWLALLPISMNKHNGAASFLLLRVIKPVLRWFWRRGRSQMVQKDKMSCHRFRHVRKKVFINLLRPKSYNIATSFFVESRHQFIRHIFSAWKRQLARLFFLNIYHYLFLPLPRKARDWRNPPGM